MGDVVLNVILGAVDLNGLRARDRRAAGLSVLFLDLSELFCDKALELDLVGESSLDRKSVV